MIRLVSGSRIAWWQCCKIQSWQRYENIGKTYQTRKRYNLKPFIEVFLETLKQSMFRISLSLLQQGQNTQKASFWILCYVKRKKLVKRMRPVVKQLTRASTHFTFRIAIHQNVQPWNNWIRHTFERKKILALSVARRRHHSQASANLQEMFCINKSKTINFSRSMITHVSREEIRAILVLYTDILLLRKVYFARLQNSFMNAQN